MTFVREYGLTVLKFWYAYLDAFIGVLLVLIFGFAEVDLMPGGLGSAGR